VFDCELELPTTEHEHLPNSQHPYKITFISGIIQFHCFNCVYMCLTRTPVSTRSAPTKRKEFGCVCNSKQIFAKTTVNIEQKQYDVMVSRTIETLFSENQAQHMHQSRQRRRHADKIAQIGVEWHRIETILTKFRQQRVSIIYVQQRLFVWQNVNICCVERVFSSIEGYRIEGPNGC
jgi:hypothetical protein